MASHKKFSDSPCRRPPLREELLPRSLAHPKAKASSRIFISWTAGDAWSQRVSASWASEVFAQHLLQRRCIEHRLIQPFLSLRFSSSSAFSLRASEISISQSEIATCRRSRRSCRASGTHHRPITRPRAPSAPDDLLFGKSALAHVRLPKERTLPKIGGIYGEQVKPHLLPL